MSLKVLSWNIWGGKYLDKVLEELKEIDADILALQEIREEQNTNQAEYLATELGLKYIYCEVFKDDRHGGDYRLGNAVLSKFPIKNAKCIHLSHIEDYQGDSITEPRGALKAEIIINDSILNITCTHLGYSRTSNLSPIRAKQLQGLLKILEKENTVLLGDFNSIPNSEVISELEKVLQNTDQDLTKITKVDNESEGKPEFRIDYIFVSQDVKFNNFQVLKTEASDHNPIIVEVNQF